MGRSLRFCRSDFRSSSGCFPDRRKSSTAFPQSMEKKGGLKIAREQYETVTTPQTAQREVSREETSAMFRDWVKPSFPDLGATCVKSTTCLYTMTPDSQFVIDNHPELDRVIIASPCSGH